MKKIYFALSAISLLFFIFFLIKIVNFYRYIYHPKSTNVKKAENKTSYNMLLLGYGGGRHEGTYLTDSMMLIHADLKTKKVSLISLPRDLWVKLPTYSGEDFHSKINAVYQIELFPKNYPDANIVWVKKNANINLVAYAVYQVTGLKIDNILTVDFSTFKKAIDAIGGVDIEVNKTFDDYQYPIDGKEKELCGKETDFEKIKAFITPPYNEEDKKKTLDGKPDLSEFLKNINEKPEIAFPCRYEHLHFEAGKIHMNGETALKYVRSRYGLQDGGDFGRAARQQQFITAIREKVINFGFLSKIPSLLDSLKEDIKIDVSPDEIKKFMAEMPKIKDYTINYFVLSDDNYLQDSRSVDGQFILIPNTGIDNWTEIHNKINNIMLGITGTPTASVKK